MLRGFPRAVLLLALLMGFVAGVLASHSSPVTWAGVRKPAQRLPVPSGAQQSVVVLQRMATTLQSIDARLKRIEATIERAARQPDKEER